MDSLTRFNSIARVFIDKDQVAEFSAEISGRQARRLVKALRMQVGDLFGVLDGTGGAWVARIEDIGRDSVKASLLEAVPSPHSNGRVVEMVLPALKGDKLDWALQKCTEIGVSAFHIVPMHRCVSKWKADGDGKIERCKAILTSAAEQCRAFVVPQLTFWTSAEAFRAQLSIEKRLIAWEDRGEPAGKALQGNDPCVVCTGPEGGFSESEMTQWLNSGFKAISLGTRILRAETAPVAIASLALLR